MKQDKMIYDITIIGGGPVGLFASFYGGMRNSSVKIIESLPQLGGQLSTLYPEKYIYDVAGFPKIRAKDLITGLKEQMAQFNPKICLQQTVKDLDIKEDGTIKLTTDIEEHLTRTVIITAGIGAFNARKIGLEGSEKYENKNIHYFIDDLEKFRNKKVMVCGGGDSAIDWALMLEPIAEKVILVHRREKFRAHEHSVTQLDSSNVTLKTPYVPVELVGNDDRINKVILERVTVGTEEAIEVDEVIINFGFVSSLGSIKNWGLEIEKNSIVVNSKMETNIPGVYAAGDICTFDGKVKLIATGLGEAPTAVNNAKSYLDPKAKVQPLHSTSVFA
ncbi:MULTISPECIES: NAD(P)/FAD-dependent oxidoreductase [Bacillus]|uniref:Ferredoxin--NADP reductase n=2 Tax=Bacillus TaxID=1386 RepID=A0A0M5JCR1_9BACI|nr:MULTISPECIES: NAD(P)/FAD-dependent oxidoreductase [Bacillus]ALC83981.1 ferredoxin-NADP reductase [Bacillus gobiensis]MBP1082933.1 thioredoxin reductase (NADPH) [Bacillus capparidis]MED1098087.1 NAD(P)/FAD-dependent oxidoreductase [Bacillus capparidis]